MNPEIAFKLIFRLMLFCMAVHVMVYLWVISINNPDWCSRRITNNSVYLDLNPPYKLWNDTWKAKEIFWCGL